MLSEKGIKARCYMECNKFDATDLSGCCLRRMVHSVWDMGIDPNAVMDKDKGGGNPKLQQFIKEGVYISSFRMFKYKVGLVGRRVRLGIVGKPSSRIVQNFL